ncbi:unnamed protein product [Arabis nemorensis]|uniref:Uncharacterized protein n=1 Tax=Arabis nemorensis TaxID=586526 RepID=A0A565BHL5_9BRAS|nr:unnamed protein product [Arabis nemorensis]
MALRPYCSQDHQFLAQNGEVDGRALIIVDGMDERHARFWSKKCLEEKQLDQGMLCGIPLFPEQVLLNLPWVQDHVFDRNLRDGEAVREWLFRSVVSPPQQNLGQYHSIWQWPWRWNCSCSK